MSYCRDHGTNNCPECTTEAVRAQTKVLIEIRDLLKPRPWVGARLLAWLRSR